MKTQQQEQVASLPAYLKALIAVGDKHASCRLAHRAGVILRFPVFVTHR